MLSEFTLPSTDSDSDSGVSGRIFFGSASHPPQRRPAGAAARGPGPGGGCAPASYRGCYSTIKTLFSFLGGAARAKELQVLR